jgi:alkylresorcinol/alkylpyrone synthase
VDSSGFQNRCLIALTAFEALPGAYSIEVTHVRIARVAVAHPPYRVAQGDAADLIGAFASDARRIAALARGTGIAQRALARPVEEIAALGGIEARNTVYHEVAPRLAFLAAQAALGETPRDAVQALVTSSCTGYTVPSWGVGLAQHCGFSGGTMRLPITEAGCAGGVVGLARAADHLVAHGGAASLVVAVELCSLAFHPGGDEGNNISTLIFGDGAGAALMQTGAGPGLEIVDSITALIPGTQAALGFALTDQGFYPLLSRSLASLLPGPTATAVATLLARNSLATADIAAWLLHPGGARILQLLERELAIGRERTRWSWDAMQEFGNTSSAAIFDVLKRYFDDASAGEYAVVAAFGPGVSIELLLLRAT